MNSTSGVSSPFRASGADFDEEKNFGVFETGEWHKPAELRSNLDRFRLMVGITTAPSMQAHGKQLSLVGRIVHATVQRVFPPPPPPAGLLPAGAEQNPRNSIMRPEPAHIEPGVGAGAAPSIQPTNPSVLSSSGPKKEVVEVDVVAAPNRASHNLGIYQTVVAKGKRSRKSYKYASLLINTCLGLQIVVAAALTALGAADHSGSSITALGAINTVIAGFLTYLKGSGLPGRLKYFQHEWDKIRDYIEARERDLRVNDNAFDVNDQVDYIRYMFDMVKKDIDNNRADRFTSAGALHTMSDSTDDAQRMQKKKLVELGKSVLSEIKETIQHESDAAKNTVNQHSNAVRNTINENTDAVKNLGKQAERQVAVQDAVKSISAEMGELKKRLHDTSEFEAYLHRILHPKSVEKPEQH